MFGREDGEKEIIRSRWGGELYKRQRWANGKQEKRRCVYFYSPWANGTQENRVSVYFISPWANGKQKNRVSVNFISQWANGKQEKRWSVYFYSQWAHGTQEHLSLIHLDRRRRKRVCIIMIWRYVEKRYSRLHACHKHSEE